MTPAELTRALQATGADPESRASRAARLVLVGELTPHQAARDVGIHRSAVYRAVRRLSTAATTCPTCGRDY